jgi:hypothetical protein
MERDELATFWGAHFCKVKVVGSVKSLGPLSGSAMNRGAVGIDCGVRLVLGMVFCSFFTRAVPLFSLTLAWAIGDRDLGVAGRSRVEGLADCCGSEATFGAWEGLVGCDGVADDFPGISWGRAANPVTEPINGRLGTPGAAQRVCSSQGRG